MLCRAVWDAAVVVEAIKQWVLLAFCSHTKIPYSRYSPTASFPFLRSNKITNNMNKRILSALLSFVLLVSCAKSDDDETPVTTTAGWKLGTNTYTSVFSMRVATGSNTAVTSMDAIPTGSNSANVNTFIAYFPTVPTTNGTYRVAAYPSALTATQVGIAAGGPNGTYVSTGAGTVDATVTVTGGKLTITVPNITVKKTNSTEELTASGTIKEQ
jgi:hypothetical protein